MIFYGDGVHDDSAALLAWWNNELVLDNKTGLYLCNLMIKNADIYLDSVVVLYNNQNSAGKFFKNCSFRHHGFYGYVSARRLINCTFEELAPKVLEYQHGNVTFTPSRAYATGAGYVII